jgi:DNA-binding MarR family transcriptional regulator
MPAPSEQLVEEFGQAMQEFQRSLDLLDQRVADKLGLNRTDLRCLELLFGPEPMSPGELAKAAHLTTGGVTTAIDRLERAGYATRVRDTVDRRRSVVQLTARSAAVAAEIYQPIAEEGGAHLRELDSATLGRLVEFLRFSARLQTDHAARLIEGQ